MIYCFDTSAFLDGWIRFYPPDIIPGLWLKLEELIKDKRLISTEEVLFELSKKDDDVYKWAKKNEEMFISIDNEIQIEVKNILNNHKKLIDTRKSRSGADPFVIALAKIKNCTVITGEKFSSSEKRPTIPYVCSVMGIQSLDILQLCRKEKWIFT